MKNSSITKHADRVCGKSPAKGIGRCHHFDATIRRNSYSIGLWCKGNIINSMCFKMKDRSISLMVMMTNANS